MLPSLFSAPAILVALSRLSAATLAVLTALAARLGGKVVVFGETALFVWDTRAALRGNVALFVIVHAREAAAIT